MLTPGPGGEHPIFGRVGLRHLIVQQTRFYCCAYVGRDAWYGDDCVEILRNADWVAA
jgi:hypothetical protein